jgi:hydrogenase maturation protein HypF
MKLFDMCDDCRREYEDPHDRRFHAQPIACPRCGPHLELWDADGSILAAREEALERAARALLSGATVAVKGIGGFQLMTVAKDDNAVRRLRERKHREEKPFALMFPDLEAIAAACAASPLESRLLRSPEAPIVLLNRRVISPGSTAKSATADIAPSVAPRNPFLGAMLPYTPLHHLLLREVGEPVVATSGNVSDEPICTDEREALDRLRGIADLFLVHNRPIHRYVDDSVARIILGRELVLRRARGYAPLPITVARPIPEALAVGGHLKNTFAVSRGANVFVSQHIGDLETEQSLRAFRAEIGAMRTMYAIKETQVVSDLHPDYLSTRYARETGLPCVAVQHHYAHVAACMAENGLEGEVLGVAWDGTGYGTDGSVWGGEFLLTDKTAFTRKATLRRFRLPGGETAIKEPRRCAVGLLYEMYGEDVFRRVDLPPINEFSRTDLSLMHRMMVKEINSPVTTSAGRLFDVVSSLLNIRLRSSFEGQAAMELEFAIDPAATGKPYTFHLLHNEKRDGSEKAGAVEWIVDWAPMIEEIIDARGRGETPGRIAKAFHDTLAEIIVGVAQRIGTGRVALTGGCFQNRYLTERSVTRLQEEGFRVYWHQRVPPNDGGISLGQMFALARMKEISHKRAEAHDVSGNSR